MDLQHTANKAISALQAGDWQTAVAHMQQAIRLSPKHPELFHILAMALKTGGHFEQAAQAFEQCLSLQPSHAIALGNYANLHYQQNAFALAEKYYQQALTANPKHTDAAKNYALMLAMKLQRYDDALTVISPFNEPSCQLIRADILDKKGEHEAALNIIDALSKAVPANAELLLRRGRLLRSLGFSKQALDELTRNREVLQNHPEYPYLLACLHYDEDQLSDTETLLKEVLQQQPLNMEAHQALNQLYWEEGRDKDFLNSYLRLRESKQYDTKARMSEVTALVNAKRFDEALQLIDEGRKTEGDLPQYLHAAGAIASRTNQLDTAEQLLRLSANSGPQNARWQLDLASVLIKKGNYQEPLVLLESIGRMLPNNQEIWAYKGLCWRLLGDERYQWLYDFDNLVDYSPLPILANYDDAEDFFSQLEQSLKRLHRASRQPLDQSVDGGTQTMGNLFAQQDPVIQDYKQALQLRVHRFLEGLPKGDIEHPFYRRLTQQFRFSGAWSVCLSGEGFHTNHMHPEGWLSGPCYVSVPSLCNPNDPEQKGWVTIGETSLNLGDREETGLALCPERGMSLLFPSYMWHGTRKFYSAEQRITAPCDVMPN